jgi:PKD repeat protein
VDNYDFNGDQIQDIVIGRYAAKQGVGVLLGDGEGNFIHSNTYFGGSVDDRYAIAAPPYVQNKSPVAVIDPDYQEIAAGETIFFDGEGSYDEDGEVVSYTWDFGEQSLSGTQISRTQSLNEGFSAQHVFYQAGLYTITLTVTDDKGATNSVQAQVRVKPLEVKIKFTPHTLNTKSRGKWVQATIWLPKGYDISQIDHNSLCIVENQAPVVYAHVDHKWKKFKKRFKKKRVRMLKVKFDRQALLAALSGPAGAKTLQVQGRLQVQSVLSQGNAGSISFEGTGKIRTIEPRVKQKPDKKVFKKDRPHKEDKKLQKFLKKLSRWLSLHR